MYAFSPLFSFLIFFPNIELIEEFMHLLYHVRYAGAPVDFEEVKLDHSCSDDEYDHAILAIERNGVALKGNMTSL